MVVSFPPLTNNPFIDYLDNVKIYKEKPLCLGRYNQIRNIKVRCFSFRFVLFFFEPIELFFLCQREICSCLGFQVSNMSPGTEKGGKSRGKERPQVNYQFL